MVKLSTEPDCISELGSDKTEEKREWECSRSLSSAEEMRMGSETSLGDKLEGDLNGLKTKRL